MVQINFAAREINCKIVYYGPGRSGKTTNLEQIHATSPKKCVGEMVSIATETDRTLFFDFLPLDIGKVAGMQVRFQLYTVPGQVYYNATRKLVLQGVDGVVFVADSQRSMFEENVESLQNLFDNLRENGYDPDTIPLVMQWNKQDLPDLTPIEELEANLNPKGLPSNGAVAIQGKGVFESLKKIAYLVLEKLNKEYGGGKKEEEEEKKAAEAAEKKAAEAASPKAPAAVAVAAPAAASTKPPAPPAPKKVAPPPPPPRKAKPVQAPPRPRPPAPVAAKKAQEEKAKAAGGRWIWILVAAGVAAIFVLIGIVIKSAL